ncbi:MAG: hypothetical protein Q9164_005519, partial [Protoblastenia rupestris]
MSESQPDYEPAIQEFHQWRESEGARRSGIRGSDNKTTCSFIPVSILGKYLVGQSDRIERLLQALFRSTEMLPPEPSYVRAHYLRPFAILLSIGQGRMILQFVLHKSLEDHRLPFRGRPTDFPLTIPDSYHLFESHQWQFCASKLEYDMRHHLDDQAILPITQIEEIGNGENAVFHKIVVEENYNGLLPPGTILPELRFPYRNTFILKTFYDVPNVVQCYHDERDAFVRLRWGWKPAPDIIGFYGSFVRGNTYNLILEYADLGTLEHFIQNTVAPSDGQGTSLFWERLSNVTLGLLRIHNTMPKGDIKLPQVPLGWHHDIKPANILVFSGDEGSVFDCHFKIADLGLVHSEESHSLHHNVPGIDAFGTRAYDAPETYGSDLARESWPLSVKQGLDIWSLGCVFSEVATWVVHGWKQVSEYRRRRQAEVKDKLDPTGKHLFHDGSSVLKTVLEVHDFIMESSRIRDPITVTLLEGLVHDMLQPNSRPYAKLVYEKSKRLIRSARRELDVLVTPVVSVGPSNAWESEVNTSSRYGQKPMTPPNVPPIQYRLGSDSSVRSRDDSPKARSPLHDLQTRATVHRKSVPAQAHQHFLDVSALSGYQGRIHYHDTNGENIRTNASPEQHLQSLHKSQVDTHPLQHSSQPIKESSPDDLERDPGVQIYSDLDNPHDTEAAISLQPEASRGPSVPSLGKGKEKEMQLECSKLSRAEGLRWKSDRKAGMKVPIPGEEYLTEINARDHVFVIDNAASMRQYSSDIREIVALLGYVLKDSDPNSISICFSRSSDTITSGKNTKDLLKALGTAKYTGTSNMQATLSTILHKYKACFGTEITKINHLFKKPKSRPLNL